MNNCKIFLGLLVLAIFQKPIEHTHAKQKLKTALSKHDIKIDYGFKGTKISLLGHRDSNNSSLVVTMTGEKKPVNIAKKEKGRFNVWMVKNIVIFNGVPSFYQLLSNTKIENILPQHTLSMLEIGIKNLDFNCTTEQDLDQVYKAGLNVVVANTKSGIFTEKQENGIKMLDGRNFFSTNLIIPSNIKEGFYTITTFLIKNHQITQVNIDPFYIEKAGISYKIASLAQNHKMIYLGACISLAVATGTLSFLVATIIMKKNLQKSGNTQQQNTNFDEDDRQRELQNTK